MSNLTVLEFQEVATSMIKERLASWENGDVRWNVSNQFDSGILENAVENLENVDWQKMYSELSIANFGVKFQNPVSMARWIDDKFADAEQVLQDFVDSQY